MRCGYRCPPCGVPVQRLSSGESTWLKKRRLDRTAVSGVALCTSRTCRTAASPTGFETHRQPTPRVISSPFPPRGAATRGHDTRTSDVHAHRSHRDTDAEEVCSRLVIVASTRSGECCFCRNEKAPSQPIRLSFLLGVPVAPPFVSERSFALVCKDDVPEFVGEAAHLATIRMRGIGQDEAPVLVAVDRRSRKIETTTSVQEVSNCFWC